MNSIMSAGFSTDAEEWHVAKHDVYGAKFSEKWKQRGQQQPEVDDFEQHPQDDDIEELDEDEEAHLLEMLEGIE